MKYSPAHKYTNSQRPLFGRSGRRPLVWLYARRGHRSPASVRPQVAGLTTRLPTRRILACRVGPVATVRDGSRLAANGGPSARSDAPGAEVSVAEALLGPPVPR